MSGLVPIQIEVENWDTLHIMRALPRREDPWGVLGCLRGTVWESAITVVSGEILSHALHGHVWPLMRVLGPPPKDLCKVIAKRVLCSRIHDVSCTLRDAEKCHPGPNLPSCYQVGGELSPSASAMAFEVALALSDGCYVLVTEGKTFSL